MRINFQQRFIKLEKEVSKSAAVAQAGKVILEWVW